MRVFGQTIAPGSTWGIEDWDTSAIPKITILKWQLDGVERRRNRARDWHYWGGFRSRQDVICVYTLDYKKALEKEKAWGIDADDKDAGNKDFEDQSSHDNGSTAKGDDKCGHSWLDYDFGDTAPDDGSFEAEESEDGQSDDGVSSNDESGDNGFEYEDSDEGESGEEDESGEEEEFEDKEEFEGEWETDEEGSNEEEGFDGKDEE